MKRRIPQVTFLLAMALLYIASPAPLRKSIWLKLYLAFIRKVEAWFVVPGHLNCPYNEAD